MVGLLRAPRDRHDLLCWNGVAVVLARMVYESRAAVIKGVFGRDIGGATLLAYHHRGLPLVASRVRG